MRIEQEAADALIVNLDLPGGNFFMPLFDELQASIALNDAIENKIKECVRNEYSPRHVPEKIYQAPDIAHTLAGKKMEIPVRRILMGMPLIKAVNISAMASPSALDYFVLYASTQKDFSLS